MMLRVIGAAFGRTGTNALRLALNDLRLELRQRLFAVDALSDARVLLKIAAIPERPAEDAAGG